MNIGIDFDNTIAKYDASFKDLALAEGFIDGNWEGKGKTELRNYLCRQPNGGKAWMKLQGLVYGKHMHRAELVQGVANFFLSCKGRNHRIYIVSHKTEHGHFDPDKINLRQEALQWMEAKRFFDPDYFAINRENVFFANTREEKVEKIAQLECNCFIDDLPEVFEEKKFPLDTKKILFGKFEGKKIANDASQIDNWSEISDILLSHTTGEDIIVWANRLVGQSIEKIEKIPSGGNSQVYKIVVSNGKTYALKYYPDQLTDARLRLKTEFHAFRILHQNNITNVPKVVEEDEDLNLGIYEWIKGEPVNDPTLSDLDQAINFVEKLHLLSRRTDENDIKLASEACLSAVDLIGQIEGRFKRLNAVKGSSTELSIFLKKTFEPLWKDVKEESYSLWPFESRVSGLSREKQTLSSSDFGFHNALRESSGKLIFIDFDYFGWDDPVKLTADFIWHPAMKLNSQMTKNWKETMLEFFSNDPHFEDRLNVAIPLYGLRWAMIVLNEFLPEYAERRKKASETSTYDLEKSRKIQLNKAGRFCDRVNVMSSAVSYA